MLIGLALLNVCLFFISSACLPVLPLNSIHKMEGGKYINALVIPAKIWKFKVGNYSFLNVLTESPETYAVKGILPPGIVITWV